VVTQHSIFRIFGTAATLTPNPLPGRAIHYTNLAKPPSPLVFPWPRTGEGKEFPPPLLPFWEKGLGDEGNPGLTTVSSTFA
jgi:hypothetical protein